MRERWVCKRCWADNEGSAAACSRCGLARGADATDADRGAWGAPVAAQAERPGWHGLLRYWWVGLIAVVLVAGYLTTARRGDDGALVTAGTVDVTELMVGDCFDSGEEGEISDVDGVPCDEPHDYEVFVVEEHEADAYPGEAAMDAIFASICVPSFESYVGTSYATSALYAGMITPSQASWGEGDREFTCYLYEPVDDTLAENVPLTGSMRGAGR